MDKLRGTGKTFSTSGKPWLPFRTNPKTGRKLARLHRLKAKGLAPTTDKASMRQAATEAAATHRIRRIP
jgi:hypothetical protein